MAKYGIVKPKPGMICRAVEDGKILPESGRRVRISSFWIRRINDGDVTVEYETAENLEEQSNG